jgi:hypothetical protein
VNISPSSILKIIKIKILKSKSKKSLNYKNNSGIEIPTLLLLSSLIQTLLSALEFHQIMPFGSWALPPVGNCTLP